MKNNLEKIYKYEYQENGDLIVWYVPVSKMKIRNAKNKTQEELNTIIYKSLLNYSTDHGMNEHAWDSMLKELEV